MFLLFKYLHILCVAASFSLLFLRGLWLFRAFPAAQETWVRMLPHAVDGLLVLTALAMMSLGNGKAWPDWLWAKLAYIVVYAILSTLAFRVASKRWQKGLVWISAMLTFLFITTVAVLQNPLGILSVLR